MEKIVIIERPIDEVFEYVADCRNSKGYLGQNFHFEATTPPPFGLGTKAAMIGHFLNFNIRLNYTITDFQSNRLIRLRAPNQTLNGVAVDSEAIWQFRERGPNRTAVSFRLDIVPQPQSVSPIGMMIARPIIQTAEFAVGGMLDKAMLRLKQTLERGVRAA